MRKVFDLFLIWIMNLLSGLKSNFDRINFMVNKNIYKIFIKFIKIVLLKRIDMNFVYMIYYFYVWRYVCYIIK